MIDLCDDEKPVDSLQVIDLCDVEDELSITPPTIKWSVHLTGVFGSHKASVGAVKAVRKLLNESFSNVAISYDAGLSLPFNERITRVRESQFTFAFGSSLLLSTPSCLLELFHAKQANKTLLLLDLIEGNSSGIDFDKLSQGLEVMGTDFVHSLLSAKCLRALQDYQVGLVEIEKMLQWLLASPRYSWIASGNAANDAAVDAMCSLLCDILEPTSRKYVSKIVKRLLTPPLNPAAIINCLQKYGPKFPSSAQELCALVDSKSSSNSLFRKDFVDHGACKAVVGMLKGFCRTDSTVTLKAISALWSLAYDISAREELAKLGACELVVSCLDIYGQTSAPICVAACGAAFLLALCGECISGGKTAMDELREAGVCVHIRSVVMSLADNNRQIAFYSCALAWLLSHDRGCAEQFTRMQLNKALASASTPAMLDSPCRERCLEILERFAVQRKPSGSSAASQKAPKIEWEVLSTDAAMTGLVDLHTREVEEQCTPKCPKCKLAWHDFDNCAMLYCRNASCGATFCGLCCATPFETPAKCYEHLRFCTYSPSKGLYHFSVQQVQGIHKIRNRTFTREYVAALNDPDLRARLKAQSTVAEHLV